MCRMPPFTGPFDGHVKASVVDLQGNITRVDRHFTIDCGGDTCIGCVNGRSCCVGTDCQSGHCIDGTCQP